MYMYGKDQTEILIVHGNVLGSNVSIVNWYPNWSSSRPYSLLIVRGNSVLCEMRTHPTHHKVESPVTFLTHAPFTLKTLNKQLHYTYGY